MQHNNIFFFSHPLAEIKIYRVDKVEVTKQKKKKETSKKKNYACTLLLSYNIGCSLIFYSIFDFNQTLYCITPAATFQQFLSLV